MKKGIGLLLALLLMLAGCGKKEDMHPEWGADLTRIGEVMAAQTPDGFTLAESNDALAPGGIYYLTWTSGAGRTLTNADGQEATAYDAQLYVLLMECADEAAAQRNVENWLQRERETYETGEQRTDNWNGQTFTRLPLLSGRPENPYARGSAAFGARGRYAISAELLCAEGFSGDPDAILDGFLQGLQY